MRCLVLSCPDGLIPGRGQNDPGSSYQPLGAQNSGPTAISLSADIPGAHDKISQIFLERDFKVVGMETKPRLFFRISFSPGSDGEMVVLGIHLLDMAAKDGCVAQAPC